MKWLGFNKKRILSSLILLLLFAVVRPSTAVALADPNLFREYVFQYYGFKETARNHIRANSSFRILEDGTGGGGWSPWNNTVTINGEQDQAALHELSHVWWHTYRVNNPQEAVSLAKAVVQLAYLDPQTNPQFQQAIDFAKGYIFGGGDWRGMYCNLDRCADPQNLQSSDFDFTEPITDAKVNDWEIYAGFSSWTMGRFKDGPHALPQFLWRYFEPQFTGNILVTPYYDGGPQTSYYLIRPELAPVVITNVSPNPVRPGTLLQIKGRGFGTQQDSVLFRGEGSSDNILPIEINVWGNDFIVVRVPENIWSGIVMVRTKSGQSSYPITITRPSEGGSALLLFSATCGAQQEPVVARIQVRYGLLHPNGTRDNQTLALNTLGAREGQGRAAAIASLEQPFPYKLKFVDVFPDYYNDRLPTPTTASIYITDTSVNQAHSFSFHYPQCEAQSMPSTSATQQYPEYDTLSSGSSLATPSLSLELKQSCNPTQLVAHWNAKAEICEANIIAGSTFYPISTLCEAAWNGTAIPVKDGDSIPIVDGGTYELAVKRNGEFQTGDKTARFTVQCAKAGAKEGGPAVTNASCQLSTAEADNYPQCGGTCEGVTYDQSRTVLVKVKRDSNGKICGYQCDDIGARPGQCGNSPEQPGVDGPEKVASLTLCKDEVRAIATSRGAPDARERGLASADEVANDVCGRAGGDQNAKVLELFRQGCDTGVQFGVLPGVECGGVGAPAKPTVIGVFINGQDLTKKPAVDIQLSDTEQTQTFDGLVQYSDGSSKPFHIKFKYSKEPVGAPVAPPSVPVTPGAPGTCRDDPVPAPDRYKWTADCTDTVKCGMDTGDGKQPNERCPKGANNQEGWCYGFDGPNKSSADWRCLKLESISGGGGSGSNPPPPSPSDSCKTEVKSIATSRNAPDKDLEAIANDVCGRGKLDLFKKGCDGGVIYGTVPGADCGGGSSPTATQPVKDTSKEDCGTRGGNHCANKDIPASIPIGCQDLGATFDCTGGCFKCK